MLTKDRGFVDLVCMHGAPPQIVWITCGNTSNANLQRVAEAWPSARDLLSANERLVEIGGRTP